MKKLIIITFCLSLLACDSTEQYDDPIPFGTFAPVIINITLPAYNKLLIDGNYIELGNVGNRGIIVYRENATTFRAFEQNCSFKPNTASATVEPRLLDMFCSGCSSAFDYEGQPTGGQAWRPLGQYETHINGSTLTVTDFVINY